MGAARLTISASPDHGLAQEIGEADAAAFQGQVFVRAIVSLPELAELEQATWRLGGEVVFDGPAKWEPWGDGRICSAPGPLTISGEAEISADLTTSAGPISLSAGLRFITDPEPEPNPVVDALAQAGASPEEIDLLGRRHGGEILSRADSAALLQAVARLDLGALDDFMLVWLADIAVTVHSELRRYDGALDRILSATGTSGG